MKKRIRITTRLKALALLGAIGMMAAEVSGAELSRAALPAAAPLLPLPEQQETQPQDVRLDPFVENAPEIVPTPVEAADKMILFSRPLTEPVWAESRPLPFERVEKLSGWGAQKQFVTLNFAVYPLADLKDLRVQVKGSGVQPELRLVRYWKVIYPNYNSHYAKTNKRCRLMPEFLAPSNGLPAAAAKVPQRFMLTFELPAGGTEKLSGEVLVWHAGMKDALKLPYEIDVLPFQLKQDPKKHYSAYFYQLRSNSNVFYRNNINNKEALHKARLAEFKRMKEYGFTRPPCLNITWGKLPGYAGESCCIPNYDEMMAELKEAGFDPRASVPAPGPNMVWIYQKFTKHQPKSFHLDDIQIDKIPESLYTHVDKALANFLDYAKKHNYPPIIFNPIDEPSPQALPYVKRICGIFKKHGCTIFQTSPPSNFKEADSLFDIYNYGSFAVPYKTAVSGKKIEYWCYPNDNAYQIKDPNVMCHGGRMTYGFGYWKSGFHCIIPWIWRSAASKRICNGGGNLLLDDGTLLMTTYWECFRLGVDDLRYVYTLEDAIVKRENSSDPRTRQAVKEAKALLQKIWNVVCPQNAYLRDNLLPHSELEGWRAQIAKAILKLNSCKAVSAKAAPSVIVNPDGEWEKVPELTSGPGMLVKKLDKWGAADRESKLEKNPDGSYLYTVTVDHTYDGSRKDGKGPYKIGWPRMYHYFDWHKGFDFTKYAYLEMDITVDSNRDAQSNYNWPLSFTVSCVNKEGTERRLTTTLEPNVKHHLVLPITQLRPVSDKGLAQVRTIQIVASEHSYPHGTILKIKLENLRLVGFEKPTIVSMDSPKVLALPASSLNCPVKVSGMKGHENTAKLTVELLDKTGKKVNAADGAIRANIGYAGFAGSSLKPGDYTIRAKITENGETVSGFTRKIQLFAAPQNR